MKLFEEFKIYEELWDDTVGDDPVSEIDYTLTKTSVAESRCKGAKCKKDLEEALSLNDHRVVLADYDTDDFDINVEFGMQDPEENEVIDYEYLLKPGQTKGDLVVWLSRDCGYTSIYVHDERLATDADVKRLASDTFPVTGTGDEWQDYGDLDESLTESDDLYGYGSYKKFSDPDLEVGDYVLTTRPFSRGGRMYPAKITSISSKWIEYEISGFGFTDKGTKARPGSASDSAMGKAAAHLGLK